MVRWLAGLSAGQVTESSGRTGTVSKYFIIKMENLYKYKNKLFKLYYKKTIIFLKILFFSYLFFFKI